MHAVLLTTVFSVFLSEFMSTLCTHTGGVVKDQAEADEGTSMKERVGMAAGKNCISDRVGVSLILHICPWRSALVSWLW